MKKYDFKSVQKYIQAHSDYIDEVYLGMQEDWFWTAEPVYENNKFTLELDKADLLIGGLSGSSWATPVMVIIFKDGTEIFKDAFIGESDGQKPAWFSLGCMSGPCQDSIDRKNTKQIPYDSKKTNLP